MLDSHRSLARLVLDHPHTANVLTRHHIDFCCHGERSIAEACAERRLRVDVLLRELEASIAEGAEIRPVDARTLSTADLIEQIVVRHHGYLREALPFVRSLSATVSGVHGGTQPSLRDLDMALGRLDSTLTSHLDHEEQVVFPALLAPRSRRSRVKSELDGMLDEHRDVGGQLEAIRRLANDFRTPRGGCSTYRALYAELAALEADLFQHVHVENHVLAPRFASS